MTNPCPRCSREVHPAQLENHDQCVVCEMADIVDKDNHDNDKEHHRGIRAVCYGFT